MLQIWLGNPRVLSCFRMFYRSFRHRQFVLLDVGCGNHGATKAKRFFPDCEYWGIDRELYETDEKDLALTYRRFELDLDRDDLSSVPEQAFDVILASHVIEHLQNGIRVISALCGKLKPGGVIYIEFPSTRSLGLPSVPGTLNFCDDPTHIRIYDVKDVANALLTNNVRIIRAGTRRWVDHMIKGAIRLPAYLATRSPRTAGALWDLLGFAEYVFGVRTG
jgi:SAM-dependent methyltransferase